MTYEGHRVEIRYVKFGKSSLTNVNVPITIEALSKSKNPQHF